jgi:hypothetical protein
MSKKALDPINLLSSASAPTVPTLNTGDTYYNTSSGLTYVYSGSAWVAIGDGTGITNLDYVTGNYYGILGTTINSAAQTANRTYYIPFFVSATKTFDRIAIESGPTFSGSAVVRLGIYNNTGGKPSTVLLDAGTVSPTVASTAYAATISQSLTPGWYWLAANTQTAATTNTYYGYPGSNMIFNGMFGVPSSNLAASYSAYLETATVTSGFATAISPGPTATQNYGIWLRST